MSDNVWVVVQQRAGKLHRMSREAIAAGQKLATATGGTVSAVVLGRDVDAVAAEVAHHALGQVYTVDCDQLADYTPGGYVGALRQALVGHSAPRFVVFPHTYQSVDFVPRLAAELDAGLVPEATGFEVAGGNVVWQRPVLGGKLQAKVTVRGSGLVLATVQSGAFPADEAVAGSTAVEPLSVDIAAVQADREILGVEEVAGDQIDLTAAPIIVAVGRGVGGPDKMGPVEELARALGAEIGASRPVIDNGWLPRDRQIGSSGQVVAPRLYLALGISGAIQHLVGMKGAQTIVAINKDASAPIFALSRYGIVGDLHEIVPALVEAVREARAR